MSDLLKEYDESTKKKNFYYSIIKTFLWAFLVVIVAIYFGNMFFGQYSLDTLLRLEATKKQLNQRNELLKEQNAKAQKDYFELKGLYPNEN